MPHDFLSANRCSRVASAAALLDQHTARNCELAVSCVDPGLAIDVDRDLLFSALRNLLQNACKFTAKPAKPASVQTAYRRQCQTSCLDDQ